MKYYVAFVTKEGRIEYLSWSSKEEFEDQYSKWSKLERRRLQVYEEGVPEERCKQLVEDASITPIIQERSLFDKILAFFCSLDD